MYDLTCKFTFSQAHGTSQFSDVIIHVLPIQVTPSLRAAGGQNGTLAENMLMAWPGSSSVTFPYSPNWPFGQLTTPTFQVWSLLHIWNTNFNFVIFNKITLSLIYLEQKTPRKKLSPKHLKKGSGHDVTREYVRNNSGWCSNGKVLGTIHSLSLVWKRLYCNHHSDLIISSGRGIQPGWGGWRKSLPPSRLFTRDGRKPYHVFQSALSTGIRG